MKNEILKKLNEIEKENNVSILFAVESGSRAWGHSNRNSDYDVRFIYKRNDINDYLILNRFVDVIQSNDGLFDFVGWDVKKALYLHFKSNPNLREWTISPIIYVKDEIGIFRDLPDFNPEILKHHYYGLAYNTNKRFVKGKDLRDAGTVKKMLYVIRCNLAWKLLDEGILPPMGFIEIVDLSGVDGELKKAFLALSENYSNLTLEKVSDGQLNMIHDWIVKSLGEFSKNKVEGPKRNIDDYNRRFQEIIG